MAINFASVLLFSSSLFFASLHFIPFLPFLGYFSLPNLPSSSPSELLFSFLHYQFLGSLLFNILLFSVQAFFLLLPLHVPSSALPDPNPIQSRQHHPPRCTDPDSPCRGGQRSSASPNSRRSRSARVRCLSQGNSWLGRPPDPEPEIKIVPC